jgi:hypothetical protein
MGKTKGGNSNEISNQNEYSSRENRGRVEGIKMMKLTKRLRLRKR